MPKEDVAVRAAAAILPKVTILAIDSDEPVFFQFFDVPAGLAFANSDFRSEGWEPRKGFSVFTGITAKATVNYLGAE